MLLVLQSVLAFVVLGGNDDVAEVVVSCVLSLSRGQMLVASGCQRKRVSPQSLLCLESAPDPIG